MRSEEGNETVQNFVVEPWLQPVEHHERRAHGQDEKPEHQIKAIANSIQQHEAGFPPRFRSRRIISQLLLICIGGNKIDGSDNISNKKQYLFRIF